MPTNKTLKPCPFCGSEVELEEFQNGWHETVYRIFCPSCKIFVRHGGATNKQELCKTWNTRYEPPYGGSVPAGNERLKKVKLYK